MIAKGKFGRKYREILAGTLLTAGILCLYAAQLSVPVISDETTTMANAAWVTGYDWSWMIDSLGGYYYRFIQALMTVPLFAFLNAPDMIYRFSMILQAIIQASIVPVVYVICRRHLKVSSVRISVLIGMAVCLVPSMALYTFYYRGDYLLGVLPWYVLLTFLETLNASDEGRYLKRIMNTILSVVLCGCAYMAHTRGIVLIIALFLSAFLTRLFLKKRSLHWLSVIITLVLVFYADSEIGGYLKNALYSLSGLNANALETTDVGGLFNIFSFSAIKDLVMLCVSWMATLIFSTQGLVLIGTITGLFTMAKVLRKRGNMVSVSESVTAVFSLLTFFGYYAVGALFFRGTYIALATKELERRVDRLLYDRYAICGAGMVVFLALYALCCKTDWMKWKGKLLSIVAAVGVTGLWIWKILPIAVRYTGYIYNTIVLNTFQTVSNPARILSGEYYEKKALILAAVLGLVLMMAILMISLIRKKRTPYVVLVVVLVSDLMLIHVNYIKIRKASNDYVVEATEEVVSFMQEFEEDMADEYPYVLKGGLSGIKIQFYQSQLMEYKMFGKNQEEQLNQDNYFIISKHGDIDLTWYDDDYYLFEDFDYENAEYDIVYVKGESLMERMEELGYKMSPYILTE
ncbi:MAG: hypothetical protein SOX32_09135 [Candidatus Choladocola sp.]|nr:hypothetical protein [Candidatus Choladocola sp.]